MQKKPISLPTELLELTTVTQEASQALALLMGRHKFLNCFHLSDDVGFCGNIIVFICLSPRQASASAQDLRLITKGMDVTVYDRGTDWIVCDFKSSDVIVNFMTEQSHSRYRLDLLVDERGNDGA